MIGLLEDIKPIRCKWFFKQIERHGWKKYKYTKLDYFLKGYKWRLDDQFDENLFLIDVLNFYGFYLL